MKIEEARDFLDFVEKVVSELVFNKQVFLDFDNALRKQHAKNNHFIAWCIRNYKKVLILDLCKILEPKRLSANDTRKQTLQYFIGYWAQPAQYNLLKDYLKKSFVVGTDIETGEKHVHPIGEQMLLFLDSMDFSSDIKSIRDMYNRLVGYRDTCLCHHDKKQIEETVLPDIYTLLSYVDKIDEIMVRYYKIFRVALVHDELRRPQNYGNFVLRLN